MVGLVWGERLLLQRIRSSSGAVKKKEKKRKEEGNRCYRSLNENEDSGTELYSNNR